MDDIKTYIFKHEGEILEGILLDFEFKNNYGIEYFIDTKKGLFVLPILTVLQRQLKELRKGGKLRIIYLGLKESQNSNFSYKNFEINYNGDF